MSKSKFEPVEVLEDWKGNEIRVGDRIYYARASGRSNEICEGEVVEIRRKIEDQYGNTEPSRYYAYSGVGSVSVLVMPLRSSRFRWGAGELDTWGIKRGKKQKPVTLTVIENITKIPDTEPRFHPIVAQDIEFTELQQVVWGDWNPTTHRRDVETPGEYVMVHKSGASIYGTTEDGRAPRDVWQDMFEALYDLVPEEDR